jgi:vitamin B12 transporter
MALAVGHNTERAILKDVDRSACYNPEPMEKLGAESRRVLWRPAVTFRVGAIVRGIHALRRAVMLGQLAAASLTSAQEVSTQLPEVVVTATRTRVRAEDVTNTVSVISDTAIQQRDDATVTEALRGAPGVDVTEFGSLGSSSFASIRGAAADQVLVMLDGVEVNTPTVGQFDFANLTTDAIDRVEVLRGGGGTLYGSSAIGGAINVLTHRGQGPWSLLATGEAGRAATNRETISLSGEQGPLALFGTVSYLGSDGFQPVNNDYQNFSTVWRADADLLPDGTLRGIVRYTNSRAGLPNFNVAEGVLDPDAYTRTDFVLVKGEWEHAVRSDLTYRADVSYVRNNQRWADYTVDAEGELEPAVIARFPTELIQSDAQVDYLWREFALTTLGVQFIEQSAQIFEQALEEEEFEVEQFNANRSNVAVFLQQQMHFLDDSLRGVGGVRYDHIDQFGDQVTWSGSGSYLIRPTDTRLRLSYAQGFRAPTFEELFEPGLGNPSLEAERSWEIDAGFFQEFFGDRLHFESTYFYRRVRNLIEEVADGLPGPIAPLPPDVAAENFNATFQGVELITRVQPWPWLTLSANYMYLDVGSQTGPALNRPRHRGAFRASAVRESLVADGDRFTGVVQVFAVGARNSANPEDGFEPEQIGGYGRTDLALAYRLAPLQSLEMTATVRNLFNRDYEESFGFPAPPAWYLLGLRYRL